MSPEIAQIQEAQAQPFLRLHEREALASLYDFRVIWHEQTHWFAARVDGADAGIAQIRIAASLAHVERVVVAPEHRKHGLGRALLQAAAETANYYNCHKMTAMAPHGGGAQQFLERCGYRVEAVLPQHTFKLDIAVLRKFLL